MSKRVLILIVFSLFCLTKCGNASVNGGWNCLICTDFVSIIEQLTLINNQTVTQSLDKFCGLLPQGLFQNYCNNLILIYGPYIIDGYSETRLCC